jgi:hypothetical protein
MNLNALALLNKLTYFMSLLAWHVRLFLKSGTDNSLKAPLWRTNGTVTELHPVNPIAPLPTEIAIFGKDEFIGFKV